MPHWLNAIILGLVEGVTEFIPVSSTAHLLIVEKFLGIHEDDLFNIVIQGAAVLAVIPLFWKQFSGMIFGLGEAKNRDLLAKFIIAFVITGIGGIILKKSGFTLPKELAPVAWALLLGGVIIFAVEAFCRKRKLDDRLTYPLAVAFGVAQLIAAVLPGASRSGSTIMLAMLLGMSRSAATEFTFLLGVPTILAASALETYKTLKTTGLHTDSWIHVAIGCIAAAISSFIVVKWLIRYVQTHTFNSIAIYRVIVGAALLVWLAKHTSGV